MGGGDEVVNKALSDMGPCLLDILTVFVFNRSGGGAPLPLPGMLLRTGIFIHHLPGISPPCESSARAGDGKVGLGSNWGK